MKLKKDLGTVRTGTKHNVVFEIPNQSDVDWTLRDMTKTCRCVLAEPVPKFIARQSSAKLNVTIEAGETSGDFDRQIRMNFVNRPGPVVLEVKTRMRTPLYVSTREFRFPHSQPGGEIRATARVENWSDTQWKSLTVTPSVGWMQSQVTLAKVSEVASKASGLTLRQAWNITLTANPPPELTGAISQSVGIQAGGGDYSTTLPVVGKRLHPLIVTCEPACLRNDLKDLWQCGTVVVHRSVVDDSSGNPDDLVFCDNVYAQKSRKPLWNDQVALSNGMGVQLFTTGRMK